MSEKERIIDAEVVHKPDEAPRHEPSRVRFGVRWPYNSHMIRGDPAQAARLIKRVKLRVGVAALVAFAIAGLLGWSAATTEHVLIAALLLIGTVLAALAGVALAALWRLLSRVKVQQ